LEGDLRKGVVKRIDIAWSKTAIFTAVVEISPVKTHSTYELTKINQPCYNFAASIETHSDGHQWIQMVNSTNASKIAETVRMTSQTTEECKQLTEK